MPKELVYLLAIELRLKADSGDNLDPSLGMILGVYEMLVNSGVSTSGGEIYAQEAYSLRARFRSVEDCADCASRLRLSLRALPRVADGSQLTPSMAMHQAAVGGSESSTGNHLLELEEILALSAPGELLLSAAVHDALGSYEPFGSRMQRSERSLSLGGNPVQLYELAADSAGEV